jgi:hypothetical protein
MCDGAVIDRAMAPVDLIADLDQNQNSGVYDSSRGGDLRPITGTGPWSLATPEVTSGSGQQGRPPPRQSHSQQSSHLQAANDDFAEFRQPRAPLTGNGARWDGDLSAAEAAPPREVSRDDHNGSSRSRQRDDAEPFSKRTSRGSRWNDDDDE